MHTVIIQSKIGGYTVSSKMVTIAINGEVTVLPYDQPTEVSDEVFLALQHSHLFFTETIPPVVAPRMVLNRTPDSKVEPRMVPNRMPEKGPTNADPSSK